MSVLRWALVVGWWLYALACFAAAVHRAGVSPAVYLGLRR